MEGLDILVRALSVPEVADKYGNRWQYHPRSDRHSKIACWAIVLDLLRTSPLLAEHVRANRVVFGLNHTIKDFTTQNKKALDLVIARPGTEELRKSRSFASLAKTLGLQLTPEQLDSLRELPDLREGSVGSVLLALEAKAVMTEHVKALPRLYDELNSSHQIVHGHASNAIAAGFVMINFSERFVSPDRNRCPLQECQPRDTWHQQPRVTESTIEQIAKIPRRARQGDVGFDAMAIVVVECENDPRSPKPVSLVTTAPAPLPGRPFYYDDDLVRRVGHLYDTSFRGI